MMIEEQKIKNRERGRIYRLNNKDKQKAYREKNKEKLTEYFRNRKYDPEKKKEYYEKNKEVIKERVNQWYSINRQSKLDYQKIYQQSNKDKRNIQLINRRKNDPLFRLITNIRNLINNSFYQSGFNKSSRTQEILKCSFEELKLYLESKFEPWMSWENRGLYNGEINYGWDIDHAVPLSSANSEEELIELNRYTNLQPLCSKINRDVKKNNILNHGEL